MGLHALARTLPIPGHMGAAPGTIDPLLARDDGGDGRRLSRLAGPLVNCVIPTGWGTCYASAAPDFQQLPIDRIQ